MHIIGRTILTATLVCGALDIASAFTFAGLRGDSPIQVLQSVARGPFGDAMRNGGATAALVGLVVHFAIMAVMVSVFVGGAWRLPLFAAHPLIAGIAYGFALYLVMYWIVLPLRWPASFPSLKLAGVASALFAHIVCVGIPLALITMRLLGRSPGAPVTTG